MSYCTQGDIEKLLPEQELVELTTESGNAVDAEVVTEAIAKADAQIDSYLGVKYAVPFASVPERVRSVSVDLAIYYLFTRRSVAPELRQRNYDNAIAYLKDVAAGRAVVMDGGHEAASGSVSAQRVEFESAERVFDRDNMTVF